MSDKEALKIFSRQPVSQDMVNFLVATTNSIIQVKPSKRNHHRMETTRHRIFLSALIVAAKSLNDSSPLNKHWTKYTDGLLTLEEVNLAERELLNILNWKTNITKEELIISLYPFLQPIIRQHEEYIQHQQYKIRMMQKSKAVGSSNSIESKLSLHSSSSSESLYSDNLSESSYNSIPIKKKRSMISIVDSTILYKN
ncbi:Cyclin, N-terminal domain family protein [Candida albicans]|uniref:Cyclin, N-terminal domain family protein n=1 Tax=Candida albicans TaxID=5476 RepID=A0A8H6F111_CANAX|nr:Cyclin, N-terminal domain family protein [Candida albicans]